jgi:hypothetical protein
MLLTFHVFDSARPWEPPTRLRTTIRQPSGSETAGVHRYMCMKARPGLGWTLAKGQGRA